MWAWWLPWVLWAAGLWAPAVPMEWSPERSCNRSRRILTGSWGTITDGPGAYPEASHCQWLIRASSPGQYITLNVTSIKTECSYDHLYVYDGETYNSLMLGVFSGKTIPPQVTASSGAMLILLYSDTNYALDGFEAEYSVTDCPLNCSSQGRCENHVCICDDLYTGDGCERQHCPENCGMIHNRGHCYKPLPNSREPKPAPYCQCNEGYFGDGCSLGANDSEGGTWHWLWRGGPPLNDRTSHASVYLPHLDRLYVYGGYNLNHILGDLLIYDFTTSVWVNVSDPASQNRLSRRLNSQRTARLKGMTEMHVINSSLLRNLTFSVNSNNTVSVKLKSQTGDAVRVRRMIRPSEEFNHTPASHGIRRVNPGPRYGHVMEKYDQHFALFGGRLISGEVSNELWLYNTTLDEWRLLGGGEESAGNKTQDDPPGLMYATLTLVDNSWLYLFGGSLQHGEFSNCMYRMNLEGKKTWEKVVVRGGNELEVRVVGHSAVFHAPSRSLLVYGGIRVDIARFSKLSDRLLVFDIDQHYWSQIQYPRSHNNPLQHIPLERAFHSAVIAGNYMVIFGGYMHKHKEEETCYDNKLYLYHLGCHVWMSHQLTPTGHAGMYPKMQGVYGHSVFLRGGNTMVIVGGFHGTVNSHVLAYVLPSTLVSPDGRDFDTDEACRRHNSQASCVSNLECGWCPSDLSCYERSRGANCTNNLQTSQCPGVCASLHSCQSCAIHGRYTRGGPCAWCVQTAKCHERDEPSGGLGRCGSPDDNPLNLEGWWGPHGNDLITPEECQQLDLRPGITVIRYRHPIDLAKPDHVAIVNTTIQELRDTQEFRGARDLHTGGSTMAHLIGFIHPLGVRPVKGDKNLMVFVQASHVNASLWVSLNDTKENLELVASIDAKKVTTKAAQRPNEGAIFTDLSRGRRYLTKLQVSQPVQHSPHIGVVSIVWNAHAHSHRVISLEYLEPYSEGGAACAAHVTCLACLTDAKCGWCSQTSSCVARHDQQSSCSLTTAEGTVNDYFLTLVPEQCITCEQYIYCNDCVGSGLCEWLPDEAYCSRKGRFQGAVIEVNKCPAPCHKRKSCATCLGDPGRCAWCQESSECFLFSVYTSVYQYGSCRVWLDEDHTNMSSTLPATLTSPVETVEHVGTTLPYLSTTASVESSIPVINMDATECHVCENLLSCDVCLESLNCGWCYNVFNPTIGICTAGDFSQPNKGDCASLINPMLHAALENTSVVVDLQVSESNWAYALCPDVDECKLLLHDCHPNATCSNTHPGFNCTCNRGFRGNGHDTCERTCFESCMHGYCSGHPEYKCVCNLGWMEPDCGTNCGCHNHSTCQKGIGICDQCRDGTDGEYCQFCQPGYFGNATTVGCQECNCNDHWDATLGQCNKTTGQCFCIHNTQGHNCQRCLPGFYGDPRNGGRCFRECNARNILYEATTGFLGAQTTGLESLATCMWIITSSDSLEPLSTIQTGTYVIQLTIEEINIQCGEGILYVYDGLPNFVSSNNRWDRQNYIVGAFCASQSSYPVTVQAVSGFMTVFYEKNDPGQGFNASYQVLRCVKNAGHNRVCSNGKLVCDEKWRGVHCDIPVCPNKCSETEGRGKCDSGYGRCICTHGFVGEDCSIVQRDHQVVVTQLFAPEKIASSYSHLTTVLPRMGHSLIVDHRGSLWVFGGYSLSRGPLNDIQQFDTHNSSNVWQQVTVNVQPGRQPPPSRYFHAAAYVPNQREMYVYGGLNETTFLKDFWKFNIDSESWKELKPHPDLPPLAGHSLTYRSDAESQSLVLIGGASSEYGFLECVWEYNLGNGQWNKVKTGGAIPVGIYGHSTVYHEGAKTFYVYGGYSFKVDKVDHFPDLYALDYTRKKWSVLPPDRRTNLNPASLPASRTFHSAVTTKDYMVIIGGDINDHLDSNQGLLVYSFKCNMWIPLNDKFITLVGHDITPLIGTSAAIYGLTIYLFGGYFGTLQGSMVEIKIPPDLCTLNANQTQCRDVIGCANCVVHESSGTNTSYCYSNTGEEPSTCRNPRYGKSSVVGVRCDARMLEDHDCYQHKSCTECLAEWPAHPHSEQRCQWCLNCSKGKCIPRDSDCAQENDGDSQTRDDDGSGRYIITDSDKCHGGNCVASDCDKCGSLKCIWTQQVLRSSELCYTLHAKPIYNWNCVKSMIQRHSSHVVESSPPNQCPVRCHYHNNCHDCLSAKGGEGGWQQCHWSPSLKECLGPSYIALRCLGGTCGLILSGDEDKCPRPCEDFTQCSHCLSHSHCGWCALDTEVGGLGLCTEGLLERPNGVPCENMDFSDIVSNTSVISLHHLRQNARLYPAASRKVMPPVSWHYDACPPEDECKNGHHTCNDKSQTCVDRPKEYECICAPGYNMTENGRCVPVCSQGCVFGTCVESNNCTCDFGFVGTNCSIKCNCNGHANCEGPDKLDICLKCFNNTMGDQCEKCKPLFVGDPRNGGQCISCFEYCNMHANSCSPQELVSKYNSTLPGDTKTNIINAVKGTEGARTEAYCVGCANNTTGPKCDSCLPGYFRGVEDMSHPCRPCQCNGHGTTCNPVWGTECNCGNNTDTQCAGSGKTRGVSTEKEEDKYCWQQQCAKCKDSYLGNPSNGHQCYRQMNVDKEYCLDPYTQNDCDTKPSTLSRGQTVFFAVQPKFMNVDIRLILDITKGGADVYFSTREDTFVVTVNQTTGQQQVEIDRSYSIADETGPIMYTSSLNRNFVGTGFDLYDVSSYTISPTKELVANTTHQTVTEYRLIEKVAEGLKTFATVSRSNEILIVKNISNRLVITLPQHQHDLRCAKFYVVVYGIGGIKVTDTFGSIFFRQDQPRIDLFVFFSVFFSCFFLFLAVCVVVWKIKQGVDERRTRRRNEQEREHMARRPFANTTLVLHAEEEFNQDVLDMPPDPTPWSPGRRKRAAKKDQFRDGFNVGPLAVEPTDDGVAAVLTVMVQLPGGGIGNSVDYGDGPTHRLALGSALCLMSRIYPPASRPFHLRRRTSHMVT
ncbi:multiple epidermal growth factor-like domains protein 8 [Procambarus clarkii]|uniref:multiple epidermal growth factor-like domains protein 8 n=1 Tax=Procambarus clarkii TaxID=6728 RepID=UPI003742F13C